MSADWPQIGEYYENGIKIRVMKPSMAGAAYCHGIAILFPKVSREVPRMKNGKQVRHTVIEEKEKPELCFED